MTSSRPPRTIRPSISLAVAMVLGSVALLIIAPAAEASDPDPSAPQISQTTVSVAFERSRVAGVPDYLVGHLALADGSDARNQPLTFWRRAEFLGLRSVQLGAGSTDDGGKARIPVVPRAERYVVTIRFGGTSELAPSESVNEIVFPPELVLHPEHAPQGGVIDPRLQPLANIMPAVLGVVVALVWLVLFVVTAFTLNRVRTEGRRQSGPRVQTGVQ